jgi:hypothetical protein
MSIVLMLFSGGFIALANLFMRKSIDQGGTAKGFLVFQMGTAFLVALLLNPVRTGNYSWNGSITILGIIAGSILAFMLFFLGRSLEKGPAGLSFSVLNGATVMPAIVMATLFGVSYGFPYTIWHAIGSVFVLFGLFWAGRGLIGMIDRKGWVISCFLMFSLHVLILVIYQLRALLLNLPNPEELVSFFTSEQIQSQWFTPVLFLSSMIVQGSLFWYYEHRSFLKMEGVYGFLGGVMNGLCTYFMIWSTEVANPFENAVIFPIFSVTTIVLSNLWSQKLYQEKINWKACQVCVAGLVIGTVDWKAVAAFIAP